VLLVIAPVATLLGPGRAVGALSAISTRNHTMLHYAVVFFVIALIAAVFGFSGIAVGAVGIAKILFVVFAVLAVASVVYALVKTN
jgi:uncharacterized membrane protein YtjA (UPF0391 family)